MNDLQALQHCTRPKQQIAALVPTTIRKTIEVSYKTHPQHTVRNILGPRPLEQRALPCSSRSHPSKMLRPPGTRQSHNQHSLRPK